MKEKIIVFEEVHNCARPLIKWYSIMGCKVYYFRLNRKCKESAWARRYLENRMMIKIGEEFNPLCTTIGYSPDLAYANIDRVANSVLRDNEIIKRLINLYADNRIYDVFKKNLFGYLQRFYYINFALYKLNQIFPEQKIYFVQTLSKEEYRIHILGIDEYRFFQDFISESGAFYYATKNIMFPAWFRLSSRFNYLFRYIALQITIIGFLFWSIVVSFLNSLRIRKSIKKNYKFAITIIGPERQFANKIQKVDFLIDENHIKKGDTLFVCWKKLSKRNRGYMRKNNLNLAENLLGKLSLGVCLKVIPSALTVLVRSFVYRRESFVLESARLCLICYAMWGSFKEKYHLTNFISYCDFGSQSIARNIILSKDGTTTWYYTDAINWLNFFISDKNKAILPLRSSGIGFLFYDNFVTWLDEMVQYFKLHHQSIKNFFNVGCLWSSHIKEINEGKIESDLLCILRKQGFKDRYKLISVFDSSYFDYSITTYGDGINFIKGIYRLLEEMPDTFFLFKEKKVRDFVGRYSKEMLAWFRKLEGHPRCYLPLRDMSTSEAIAFSDLTISFPFSSTTFEALSARKKALYYDASDKFKDTFYDKVPGLVCHNYEELFNRTKELLFDIGDVEYNKYLDNFVKEKIGLNFDGEALTRFRQLLTNSEYSMKEKVKAGVIS